MKIVITDTGIYPGLIENEDLLIHSHMQIHACDHCDRCWVLTPGRCAYGDVLQNIGYYLNHCDELVIVSGCNYGGFSAFVQKCLERMKPYLMAGYRGHQDDVYYRRRYRNMFCLSVYFYGEVDEEDKALAMQCVSTCGEMFGCEKVKTMFVASALQIGDLA